jgi:hypothetical protein
MLNASKGAAVWVSSGGWHLSCLTTFEKKGPRAQVDRKIYKRRMQDIIFSYANLDVRSASVFDLVFDNSPCASASSSTWGTVTGVRLGARAMPAHNRSPSLLYLSRNRGCDQVFEGRYLHWDLSRR